LALIGSISRKKCFTASPERSAHPLPGLASPGLRNDQQFGPEGAAQPFCVSLSGLQTLKITSPVPYGTGRGCAGQLQNSRDALAEFQYRPVCDGEYPRLANVVIIGSFSLQ